MPQKRKYEQVKTGKNSYKIRRIRRFRTTTKRVPAAPRGLANMRKMIRNVQLSQAETKYNTISLTNSNLKHDSITEFPIWGSGVTSVFPVQGLDDKNRVGDRLTASSIRVRMSIDIPWDRKNTKVKLYYIPYNSDQGNPTSYSQLFNSVTGNSMLDPINFKRWKGIQYLGLYTPRDKDASVYFTYENNEDPPGASTLASNTATIYVNRTIKMNRKAWFNDATDTQPSNFKENGSILMLPYASTNTSTLDTIVNAVECSYTLYYKDL